MSSTSVDALPVDTARSLGLGPPADSLEGKRNSLPEWIARVVIVSTGGALAWYTWGHWGDFQIDNGREIYVPSAILRGKLLYRDLWYMYGPLAPYLKAFLFWIFGVHLTVLYLFGLALTAIFALMTFEISRQFALKFPISMVPSLFFLSEAFYPFIRNFIFPYSYAASLGAVCGQGCLYFCLRHASSQRPRHLAFSAALACFAILTKQEFGLACLLLLAFEVLNSYRRHRSSREVLRNVGISIAALAPGAAVYGWFVAQVSARGLFLENWIQTPGTYFMRTLSHRTLADQGFRWIPSELLEVTEYLVVAICAWYLLASIGAIVIRRFDLRDWKSIALVTGLVLSPFTVAFLYLVRSFPEGSLIDANPLMRQAYMMVTQAVFPSAMFFVGLFFLIHAGWKWWTTPSSSLYAQGAALGIYATLVALRNMMELKPTLYECSVFFNVSEFLVFVILLSRLIQWASRSLEPGPRTLLTGSMLAAEATFAFSLFFISPRILPARLTTDFGTFYTRPDVAEILPQVISFMRSHTRTGKDILVVPEPPSLYVFSRTEAPSKWYSLVPGYVAPEQEQQYIDQVQASHVRYILIANEDMSAFGVPDFLAGGYNLRIRGWILANYVPVGQFGPLPEKAAPYVPFIVWIYEIKDAGKAARKLSDTRDYFIAETQTPRRNLACSWWF